jgi:hypothetical protein
VLLFFTLLVLDLAQTSFSYTSGVKGVSVLLLFWSYELMSYFCFMSYVLLLFLS